MAAAKLNIYALTVGGLTHIVQLDDDDAEASGARKLTAAQIADHAAGKLDLETLAAASKIASK